MSPSVGDPQLIAGWGFLFNTNSCSLLIHLLLQVWTGYEGPNNPHDHSPIVLGVQAQSAVHMDSECMQTYAALRYVRLQGLREIVPLHGTAGPSSHVLYAVLRVASALRQWSSWGTAA